MDRKHSFSQESISFKSDEIIHEALEASDTPQREVGEFLETEQSSNISAMEVQILPWQLKRAKETIGKQRVVGKEDHAQKENEEEKKTNRSLLQDNLAVQNSRRSISSHSGETVPTARDKEASTLRPCSDAKGNPVLKARGNPSLEDKQFGKNL